MDGELKNLKCNICQLTAITGLHRQTVVSRLSGVPLAPGSNEKNKLYLLTDVIRVLMETPVSQAAEHQDPNKIAYSALFDHGLASKSDQRFASIRSTGNLTFSTAF